LKKVLGLNLEGMLKQKKPEEVGLAVREMKQANKQKG